MNVLFLSLTKLDSISNNGIYPDLLREFIKNGHNVYILSPVEQMGKVKDPVIQELGAQIVKIKTGRIQKTSIIEKGINTILIEPRFKKATKRYFKDIKFDLVLYPTPPITFTNVVKYIKKRDGAKSYLMLKDIFPQNAVDIGILSKSGLRGFIYRYFRRQEKKLYAVSDRIGCMSPANVKYILQHNPEIDSYKVELCPNCIEIVDKRVDEYRKTEIRKRYGIPLDKTVYLYGGNFGKPQGVKFIIECLKKQVSNEKHFFLFIGDGTEYEKLEGYMKESQQPNLCLMKKLPAEEYDAMVGACDVGLIFLDWRFTIPNFPSRLLPYLQAGLPVLAATDANTDIGRIIEENQAGYQCDSNNVEDFCAKAALLEDQNRRKEMGKYAYKLLCDKYDIRQSYHAIQKMMAEER